MLIKTARCLAALLMPLLFPFQPTLAAQCTWVQHEAEGPPARHSPGMAHESRRDVTVLFGGLTGRTRDAVLYGYTWEWDGHRWKLVATTGPSPRMGHAMVYDDARDVIVLFGGSDGSFRNDTWEWDGQTWNQVAQTGPSPRSRVGMAYDQKREVTVLFGGIPRDTEDTWEWDGTEWSRIHTESGPTGRSRLAMAYDEDRETVVMFGGRLANGQPVGDTWKWDGSTWKQLTETGTQARARHGMVYNRVLGTMVAGGVAFAGRPDTLIWKGAHWKQITAAGPTRRVYYGMVYEAARETVLLFGGWDGDAPLGDTWELRCE